MKKVVPCICILFSASLFAQSEETTEKSTIVMTKTELNSFLSKVAEARRSQLQERDSRNVKQDLANLRLQYQQANPYTSYSNAPSSISNEQLLRELNYLNQRIDNLSNIGSSLPNSGRNSSTIILPSESSSRPVYTQSPVVSKTVTPSNNLQIQQLSAKIDSLRNAKKMTASVSGNTVAKDSLNAMRNQLANVKKQMDDLQARIKNSEKKAPQATVAKKENTFMRQQVYFANNSDVLADEYYRYIQDLTQILIEYPEANIVLEGWASSTGNASYNKQLSMRRADAVKTAFVNNRIDSSRILTSFKGEDKSSSEQHARRVDMFVTVK
ncbi:OmpA family protein [Flavobacterium faecale]|nr:OmpA family protein [Flavobacterium faecale]